MNAGDRRRLIALADRDTAEVRVRLQRFKQWPAVERLIGEALTLVAGTFSATSPGRLHAWIPPKPWVGGTEVNTFGCVQFEFLSAPSSSAERSDEDTRTLSEPARRSSERRARLPQRNAPPDPDELVTCR